MQGTNDRTAAGAARESVVHDDPPGDFVPAAAPRGPGAAAEAVSSPGQESEPRLDEVMTATLRRWARPTTVEELRRRGVHRVRSVSMARMAALLEKAVNRALIERSIATDADGVRPLSVSARKVFLDLTRREVEVEADAPAGMALDWGSADDVRLHRRAVSTLDRLRRELETRRQELGDHERRMADGRHDAELDTEVQTKVAALFARHAGGDDRALEREIQSLVAGELGVSRRRARLAQREEFERDVSVLERRIAKLSALLGETEDALRRAQSGGVVEAGVASIYDRVQGLDDGDAASAVKHELMRTIFEANLELRDLPRARWTAL